VNDSFSRVEPVFQRIFDEIWANGVEDLQAVGAVERAIYATWVLEGDVDNGGWYQAFGNGTDALIEPAIDGYELMGLPEYAAVLREVRAQNFDESSPDEVGERLDRLWFELSGSEEARARLVDAHGFAA
jgi:hypothetical protein